MNASKRSRSSSQIRDAVDFESLPSPACSHSDSTSRIDRPRTNAPITIAFSGSVRSSFVASREQLGRRTARPPRGPAGSRSRAPPPRSAPCAGETRCAAPVVVAQPALIVGPALIARAAQPGVELVLDRPLDDQPRAELRQLRQRLARVLAHPHGQQLVDLLLDLRRRRYGTSHGVGLLHRLAGLEGTYAVALRRPGFTAVLRRDPERIALHAADEQRACQARWNHSRLPRVKRQRRRTRETGGRRRVQAPQARGAYPRRPAAGIGDAPAAVETSPRIGRVGVRCAVKRRTVVKHEAMAIRASRLRLLGGGDAELDAREAVELPGPWERATDRERAHRALAALATLKRDEARALVLQAAGRTYAEIEAETGWSHTKVNRALTEGRAAFRTLVSAIEAGDECARPPRGSAPWPGVERQPTPSWAYAPTCARAARAGHAWPSCASPRPGAAAIGSGSTRSDAVGDAPIVVRSSSPASRLNRATSRDSSGTPAASASALRTSVWPVSLRAARVHPADGGREPDERGRGTGRRIPVVVPSLERWSVAGSCSSPPRRRESDGQPR